MKKNLFLKTIAFLLILTFCVVEIGYTNVVRGQRFTLSSSSVKSHNLASFQLRSKKATLIGEAASFGVRREKPFSLISLIDFLRIWTLPPSLHERIRAGENLLFALGGPTGAGKTTVSSQLMKTHLDNYQVIALEADRFSYSMKPNSTHPRDRRRTNQFDDTGSLRTETVFDAELYIDAFWKLKRGENALVPFRSDKTNQRAYLSNQDRNSIQSRSITLQLMDYELIDITDMKDKKFPELPYLTEESHLLADIHTGEVLEYVPPQTGTIFVIDSPLLEAPQNTQGLYDYTLFLWQSRKNRIKTLLQTFRRGERYSVGFDEDTFYHDIIQKLYLRGLDPIAFRSLTDANVVIHNPVPIDEDLGRLPAAIADVTPDKDQLPQPKNLRLDLKKTFVKYVGPLTLLVVFVTKSLEPLFGRVNTENSSASVLSLVTSIVVVEAILFLPLLIPLSLKKADFLKQLPKSFWFRDMPLLALFAAGINLPMSMSAYKYASPDIIAFLALYSAAFIIFFVGLNKFFKILKDIEMITMKQIINTALVTFITTILLLFFLDLGSPSGILFATLSVLLSSLGLVFWNLILSSYIDPYLKVAQEKPLDPFKKTLFEWPFIILITLLMLTYSGFILPVELFLFNQITNSPYFFWPEINLDFFKFVIAGTTSLIFSSIAIKLNRRVFYAMVMALQPILILYFLGGNSLLFISGIEIAAVFFLFIIAFLTHEDEAEVISRIKRIDNKVTQNINRTISWVEAIEPFRTLTTIPQTLLPAAETDQLFYQAA